MQTSSIKTLPIVPVHLGKQLGITWKKATLVVKSEVTSEHVVANTFFLVLFYDGNSKLVN